MKKLCMLLLLLTAVGCSKKTAPTAKRLLPVKMARATSRNVPQYIATVGHMEAYQTVKVMGQVDGLLLETYFEDGADVRAGELLYLIDPRPYEAELERAEGELAQNIASFGFAERTAERNSQLVQDEYISKNRFDQLVTDVLVDDAMVMQSKAAVENAKINLGYTTIYAPLHARAGQSLVRDGNLILENAETPLVTLNQITPIYATFYINEKDLPKVQRCQAETPSLKTVITVDDPLAPSYEGLLTFVDNSVDLATGMIKLKATLPNDAKELWPNQYIKVHLVLDMIENAVVVPYEAVQNSSNGKYVYVIKGGKNIALRHVTTGQMQEDNTIVITKGIKAGEKVVTEGQINLYPGASVTIIPDEDD